MSEVMKHWIKEATEPVVIYTDYEPTVPLDLSKITPEMRAYLDECEVWQGPYREHDIFAEILKEVEDDARVQRPDGA